jgi:ribose transport system permease protein
MAQENTIPQSSSGTWKSLAAGFEKLRIERLGTVIFFLLLFAFLTAESGSKFLSGHNILQVLSQESPTILVGTGVTIALMSGQFDLSVGGILGLGAMFTVGLTANQGIPIPLMVVMVLAAGAACGLINAFIVIVLRVNSIVATLGTGTVYLGFTLWYSHGASVFENVPKTLTDLGTQKVGPVPLPIIYALVIVALMWMVTTQMSIGRRWYGIGANAEASRLAGVNVRRVTVWAYVATGMLAAAGGMVLASRLGSAEPTTGQSYLLPAFAAAFLGASTLSDGRFHVIGTAIGAFFVAYGANGLQVMGLEPFATNIFNGVVLILAVALTEFLRRRRGLTPLRPV